MPDVLRAQVTLNPAAAPDEWYVNTWHFETVGATTRTAATTGFNTALDTFYQAVDAKLSSFVNGAVPHVKYYDMTDPKPRVPYSETDLSSLTAGSNAAAPELCLVISYRSIYTSGSPTARRRGRLFIGPLNTSIHDTTYGRPTPANVASIATDIGTFLNASQASTEWRWIVYSRATDSLGTGTTGDFIVTEGYVDTNYDIQRRRGHSSAVRYAFS